jgi:D-alanyl-D-alanine carboxypeptidase
MGYICLEKETNDSFQLMYDAAQKDNVQLSVTSSYRSEDSQQYLLKVMIKQLGKVAYRIVAPPGKSEHNLGTAIDIGGYDSGHLTSVSSGKTFAWLQQHAGEYGFVNSYPVGQEEVTGFKGEPWHWRYVGIPVAQSIVGDKVTLGAFLDTFKGRFQTFYQSIQDHYYALLSTVTIGS